MLKYHFRVHHDSDGMWAECIEIPNIKTQSKDNTMKNMNKNMKEALNLYLDEPDWSIEIPLPDNRIELFKDVIVEVPAYPHIVLRTLFNRLIRGVK